MLATLIFACFAGHHFPNRTAHNYSAGFAGGLGRSERLGKKNRVRANPFVSSRALPKREEYKSIDGHQQRIRALQIIPFRREARDCRRPFRNRIRCSPYSRGEVHTAAATPASPRR